MKLSKHYSALWITIQRPCGCIGVVYNKLGFQQEAQKMKQRITFKSDKSGDAKTVLIEAGECTLEHLLSTASKKLK